MGSDDDKKKKITIVSICSLILVAMVVGVAVGVNRNTGETSSNDGSKVSTSTKAVKSICQPTEYKQTCETTLTNNAPANETDPKELIKVGFRIAIDEIKQAMKNSSTLNKAGNDPRTRQALENCQDLMDSAINDLNKSVTQMGDLEISKLDDYVEDLKVWLTGAVTFQETCVHEFENASDTEPGEKIKQFLNTSRQLTANGLDMVNHFSSVMSSLNLDGTKRSLLSEQSDEIPSWVSNGRRGLLAAADAGTIQADVIVAQDGSGKYKTINEALKDYPAASPPNKPFVVHIKEGVYAEYVTIPKNMANVMFIGDGATKTKITGNKNFVDGINTMNTATVAITGPNFIAKDMGFENSAGAIKHQAVALRVQADDAIFYNCQMDGYQDTLYVHAHRQYYRDCTITGTIDFIFGDAAAVFQNCILVVRKPMEGQNCIVTAQGRSKYSEISGIIIQNCTFTVEKDFSPVKDGHNVFLGRPWREFSRTIIMQSFLGDFIHPDGWMPWNGDFALNTCFYAEFGNKGPGSDQSKRVTWKGIKKIDATQAVDFTIGKFFQDGFIKAAGVPYTPGLMTV